MNQMERIKFLYSQLEADEPKFSGFSSIRFSDESPCELYLGIKHPEYYRMFIVRVSLHSGKNFKFKYDFKGLKFEKIYDPHSSEFILLNLILVEKQLTDVYNSLISDLIASIIDEVDENRILRKYTERLIKWQSLFEKFNLGGLSPEEQRGLYGELYFLRKLIKSTSYPNEVIDSWKGPNKEIRDFQQGMWSVEVKTTHGNNHQKVHINNERQLDASNLKYLYLYHISLDVMQESGESLINLIESIYSSLNSDFAALNQFKVKLFDAGYFEVHNSIYEKTGYLLRFDNYYLVGREFPRIEESDIRPGVGDVKYSIVVSQCAAYIEDEKNVLENFKNL